MIEEVIDIIETEIAGFLAHDYDCDPQWAREAFRESYTYENLCDEQTGLYGRSALYCYSLLLEELANRQRFAAKWVF